MTGFPNSPIPPTQDQCVKQGDQTFIISYALQVKKIIKSRQEYSPAIRQHHGQFLEVRSKLQTVGMDGRKTTQRGENCKLVFKKAKSRL